MGHFARVRTPGQVGNDLGRRDRGTFVRSDSDLTTLTSTGPSQWLKRTPGGAPVSATQSCVSFAADFVLSRRVGHAVHWNASFASIPWLAVREIFG